MSVPAFSRALLVGAFAVFAALALWATQAAQREGIHPRQAACDTCHLGGKAVNPEQAHLLRAPQEKLCAGCHQNANQVSHPSGFAPKSAVGKDYPLDWKGDMTCSTCHDIHGTTPGLMRGDRRGKALCLACHETKFFEQMRDKGVSVAAAGHLGSETQTDAATLDPYSRQCMSCHGEKGEGPRTAIDRNSIVRHGRAGDVNHPVGSRYAIAFRSGGYRPAAQLSKNVLLPGGLVSCVSCHTGYKKQHGSLVLPLANSALCFECHDI